MWVLLSGFLHRNSTTGFLRFRIEVTLFIMVTLQRGTCNIYAYLWKGTTVVHTGVVILCMEVSYGALNESGGSR